MQLLLMLCMICSFSAQPFDQPQEYTIKAAFIYKFTNYIDWDSMIPGNEFVIGVVGPSPIKSELAEIARTKTVKDKKITVLQFNKPDEIGACNILFIPEKSPVALDDILAKANNKGTLTISEKEGYAARGTGINFIVVDNKLKFEANPKAINASGLKASSQLLKLAIIVE
jgi:hypothetical protein